MAVTSADTCLTQSDDINIRIAQEADAGAICEVFQATYGKDYPYSQFYDIQQLKKLIYADDTVVVVAEDLETGQILGTASVLEEKGAHSDLVAEFGRLVVHPEARHRGIGGLLMRGRLEHVRSRLHIGLVEARVLHPYSSKIAIANGFSPVGFLPSKLLVHQRENLALLVRYFGAALSLRRNHPRIIPEAYELAHLAMENCGLDLDAIVDEQSAAYPASEGFTLEELTTEGYAALLRIERGRIRRREIFGPMRLHYGFFKLQAKNSHYLLAIGGGRLVGAVGFTVDEEDRIAQVFELIFLHNECVSFLINELIRKCRKEWEIVFIEVDVSAYAPRMQRTLLELGFLPVAYVPAHVFHHVERLDILKMVRLFTPMDASSDRLIADLRPVADTVIRSFVKRDIQPRLRDTLDRITIFSGLNQEQTGKVASLCMLERFEPGESIYAEGKASDKVYLILEGAVEILIRGSESAVGRVGAGECLGEVSTLSSLLHSASAVAVGRVDAAVLIQDDLKRLIRRRPDIGVVLYKNLAIGLGRKLHRSDLALLSKESA